MQPIGGIAYPSHQQREGGGLLGSLLQGNGLVASLHGLSLRDDYLARREASAQCHEKAFEEGWSSG
jgi:hypothetical protein